MSTLSNLLSIRMSLPAKGKRRSEDGAKPGPTGKRARTSQPSSSRPQTVSSSGTRADIWSRQTNSQKRSFRNHLAEIRDCLEEAKNFQIERPPQSFLAAFANSVDLRHVKRLAMACIILCCLACCLSSESAKQIVRLAQLVFDGTLDLFDSRAEVCFFMVFFSLALLRLSSSYIALEELACTRDLLNEASKTQWFLPLPRGEQITKAFEVDLPAIRTKYYQQFDRWWMNVNDRDRQKVENVDKFVATVDSLTHDIRQAQHILAQRGRDLARRAMQNYLFEITGAFGFLGFFGLLLCTVPLATSVLDFGAISGYVAGAVMAGGTILGAQLYQARVVKCVDNMHLLNNELVRFARLIATKHITFTSTITGAAPSK